MHIPLLMMFMLCCMGVGGAHGAMRGSVDLQYTDYSVRGKESDRLDATSFTQRYAVALYKKDDDSSARRKRNPYFEYDYLLGYEWVGFDTSVKSAASDEERKFHTGRLYYLGEVLADPPTLPLRARIYSRDLTRPSIATRTLSTGSGSILETRVADDISGGSGVNIENGANILFGVKGGMDSRYADSFSHLPLFMLDFRQRITKDSSPYSRVDTRLTELAFVSLNRKDNWFHLRYKVFDDRINPSSSWKEREYQIGTVDVRRQRKWVDLTNWIRVSADGTVTRHSAFYDQDSFDRYAVNLFFRATRRTWQMNSFSSFDRLVKGDSVETNRRIPLALSGRYGVDATWSFSGTMRDRQTRDWGGGKSSESSQQVNGRLSLFNRKPFTLSPSLGVERRKDGTGVAYVVTGALETTSTPRFSPTVRLAGRWNAEIHGKDPSQGYSVGDEEYFLQKVTLSGSWREGTRHAQIAQEAEYSTPLDSAWNNRSTHDGWGSRTTLSGGWAPSPYLDLSLSGSATFEDDALSGWRRQGSSYGSLSWRPDQTLRVTVRAGRTVGRTQNGSRDRTDNVYTSFEWTPDRNLLVKGDYSDSTTVSGGLKTPSRDFKQFFRYSWHPSFVFSRRYLDLEEEYTYAQSANSVTTTSVRFGLRWFPTQRLSLYGNYTAYLAGYDQTVYNVGGNFDFRLLQAALDYSQGKRTGDDHRTEKRWTASVRRSF